MSWLADRSALLRLHRASDAEAWSDRVAMHRVHVCGVTLLEFGVAARSADEWSRVVAGAPLALLPRIPVTFAVENRAIEVQGLMARRGQHRAPSLADLLIAASAELNGLSVLHVDKDFDLIADVTGQTVERLTVT